MPEPEIQECQLYRHSYPRVSQQLYPSVRPDGNTRQYYHLTQIPTHAKIDPSTGLCCTYQIVIRFDTNYR
jgi:hypothetical protein